MTFYSEQVAAWERQGQLDAQHENSARPLTQYFTQKSTGVGQVRTGVLMFDVPFTAEPVFYSGFAVASRFDARVWNDPYGTCGIRTWLRDDRGHFVGIQAFLKVWMDTLDGSVQTPPNDVVCLHYMTFYGPGYKKLQASATTDFRPRSSGAQL